MNDRDLDARAGEYVLGTLDGDDRVAFEARLAAEPDLRAFVDAWEMRLGSALALDTRTEPAGARVWQGIEAALGARQAENFGGVTVRDGTGEWQYLAPGAELKVLWVDEAAHTRSFLLRLQPGAQVPAHPHPTTEECYVITGDMVIGETIFYEGDYHAAVAGIRHPVLSSRGGGLIFIRGPIYD